MQRRAALVTGASSGIGLAVARMLGEEGYALTLVARRPGKLAESAKRLSDEGLEVHAVPAQLGDAEAVAAAVRGHRERWGRLDVLVNNAGVGASQAIADLDPRVVDLQIGVNLRSIVLLYRECLPMLKAAGADHGNAHVWNMASVAGKQGEAMLSVYSATKFGVVGFTQAANRELAGTGVRSCAVCPAWVDTDMTDFLKDRMAAGTMIQTSDIAQLLRPLLKLSPGALVPELQITQLTGGLGAF
jgi:NAD(P)-dependent dehydrogenase (short-subunit alcohol dehydrogenase family)